MNDIKKQFADLQQGKEAALCFFMETYSTALQFFAFRLTRNKEASSEIVSDSFVKLWDRREQLEGNDNIKPFLYLVTRNSCLDYLKHSRNKHPHQDASLLELETSDGDILKKIIYNELIELIVIEVKKLPKQQAQIFHLAIMEGHNTQEICDQLQTTPSTVYFARSKAIAALKIAFKKKNLSIHYISILPFAAAGELFTG